MNDENTKQIPDDLILSLILNDPAETDKRELVNPYLLKVESYSCYEIDMSRDLAVIFAGCVESTKGYHYRFSKYPFYRIVYTAQGEAVLDMDGKEYRLGIGTIYGVPPNAPGDIHVVSDTPRLHYYMHFAGTQAQHLFREAGFLEERAIPVTNPVQMVQLFKSIMDEMKDRARSFEDIAANYLEILLLKLINRSLYCKEHLSVSHNTYLQCRSYINANFSEISDIEQVADACSIDKGYLCRLFRKHAQTSPMSYITRLKMNKAVVLLTQTDLSIKKISYMLNFSTQYYFSQTFKRTYGVSPKYYRQQH